MKIARLVLHAPGVDPFRADELHVGGDVFRVSDGGMVRLPGSKGERQIEVSDLDVVWGPADTRVLLAIRYDGPDHQEGLVFPPGRWPIAFVPSGG